MNCKSFNLIRTSIFALPVIALSLMPARAEVGQRNIYRDTANVSVKDGSAEFARIYTAGQGAVSSEQSKAEKITHGAALPSVSRSAEFGIRMQSKEFGIRMQSKEFGYRLQSKELGYRLQ